jgi:hypothetical protein
MTRCLNYCARLLLEGWPSNLASINPKILCAVFDMTFTFRVAHWIISILLSYPYLKLDQAFLENLFDYLTKLESLLTDVIKVCISGTQSNIAIIHKSFKFGVMDYLVSKHASNIPHLNISLTAAAPAFAILQRCFYLSFFLPCTIPI